MESKHHKLEQLKIIIFSYLQISIDSVNFDTRKAPAPLIKKMIGYYAQRHFSATQTEIAHYLNLKNHSSVSLGTASLIDDAEKSRTFREKLKDIDRIIIDKGLSKLSGKNNEWYMFLDLNNFIIATKGESSLLWGGTDLEQIKTMLGEGWEFTEHKATEKFIYKRLNQTNN